MIGGSRALYSMAESYMIPRTFAKLHPKHKTPLNALILMGNSYDVSTVCGTCHDGMDL